MTDKKKTYFAPEIKVVEIEQADIICTSGQPGSGEFSPLQDGEFTW